LSGFLFAKVNVYFLLKGFDIMKLWHEIIAKYPRFLMFWIFKIDSKNKENKTLMQIFIKKLEIFLIFFLIHERMVRGSQVEYSHPQRKAG